MGICCGPRELKLTIPRSILELKLQRDKLQQYQKKITTLTDRETEIAKECLRKSQKQKALLALRRKKFQESLLAKTDLQLEQLQRLVADVEFAVVQKDVLYGLQQGTVVLKQIHAEMGGIEKVEKMVEDNAEARAYQNEISEMLGGQLSTQDEDEVEDELATLTEEIAQPEIGDKVQLPNVPKKRPAIETQQGILEEHGLDTNEQQQLEPLAA